MPTSSPPSASSGSTEPDPTLLSALVRMHLIGPGETPALVPLTGGVSSDIWRVELAAGPICVKRALPRLKVDALWEAPVERNAYEWAWMEEAAAICPAAVPPLLGHDPASGSFAMGFLDPARYRLWKAELLEGGADAGAARSVGVRIGAIHAATAGRAETARRFATDDIFHAIRLEPYLLATADRHPALAARLRALERTTAATRKALVHGDVSPKNILLGPEGPVFLDAECAWYGDPAFDLAFCANHLLLKCLWRPVATAAYLGCFDALVAGYLETVRWEAPAALERRVAHLLPGLFLARVDGKSPVEYVTDEAQRKPVRRVASRFLAEPCDTLAPLREAWSRECATL